jgi:hypothetical protein
MRLFIPNDLQKFIDINIFHDLRQGGGTFDLEVIDRFAKVRDEPLMIAAYLS